MIENNEPTYGPDHKLAVTCNCAGNCSVLFVSEWADEPGEYNFDFYSSHREDTWRQRIRAAWAALRGRGGYYHGIVTSGTQAKRLAAWIGQRAEDAP